VGDTKTLDVHVKRLRARIEPDPARPQHLLTVRGLGYKLER
jgi:two-component system response regulator RegX3